MGKTGKFFKTRKCLAYLLACSMILTNSGMTTLAGELQSETVAETEAETQLTEVQAVEASETQATEVPAAEASAAEAQTTEAPAADAPAETQETETPVTEAQTEQEQATEAAETPADETQAAETGTEASEEQTTEAATQEEATEEQTAEEATEAVTEAVTEEVTEEVTETETETATELGEAVLETLVKQEVVQKEVDEQTITSIHYTVKVKNAGTADAEDVSVKVLLADALAADRDAERTENMKWFASLEEAIAAEVFANGELSDSNRQKYSGCEVVLWQDQDLAAGAEKKYEFYAAVEEDVESTDALRNAWIINGEALTDENRIQWVNEELLTEETVTELPTEFTYEDDTVIVTAVLSAPDIFPSGVQFVAEEVELSEEDKALAAECMENSGELKYFVAYDIRFELDGEEIEPEDGTVDVKIELKKARSLKEEAAEENGEEVDGDYRVIHLEENEDGKAAEELEGTVIENKDGAVESVGFTAESFSIDIIAYDADAFTVNGEINWNDDSDASGDRPASLDLKLYKKDADQNYVEVSATLTINTEADSDKWTYSFSGGEVAETDADGNKIEYTVKGNAGTYYASVYNGYNIENVLMKSTDTFGTQNYTLEYILNHYNVFSFGNVSGSHIVGAVICQGNLTNGDNNTEGSIPFGDQSKESIPSYIKGMIYAQGNNAIADLYIGTVNEVSATSSNFSNTQFIINGRGQYYGAFNVEKTDDYVDFNAALAALNSQLSELLNGCTKVITADDIDENGNLKITAGEHVKISDEAYAKLKNVYFDYGEGLNGTLGTVVNFPQTAVEIPQLYYGSGDNLSSYASGSPGEFGAGMSIVWNAPNATTVTYASNKSNEVGHIVAPNASTTISAGNYSGTMIVKELLGGAEGHMFPYNGDALEPKPASGTASIKVQKNYNAEYPTGTDAFTFTLTAKDNAPMPEGSVDGSKTVTATSASAVSFGNISYETAGTYYYTVTETAGTLDDVSYDNTTYYIEVKVEADGSDETKLNITVKATTTEGGTYEGSGSSYTAEFTNRLVEKVSVSGTKTWVGVPAGVEKPTVTIKLYRNNVLFDSQELGEDDKYSFTDLEKYDSNGAEYTYTVEEAVSGTNAGKFTGIQDGLNFTNTYSEKTSVSGTKTWVGVPAGVEKPTVRKAH